jgi:cyclophilin family peptidyl-prolyl cis-trans isomerase
LLSVAALVAACDGQAPDSSPASSSATASAPTGTADPASGAGRAEEILRAELGRRVGALRESDLADRDVRVRRMAARAFALVRSEAARDALLRGLADEDGEVVAWCAHGLAEVCAGQREPVVRALVATAARIASAPPKKAADGGAEPLRLRPWWSIARAIGRCGAPQSERILLGWTAGDPDQASAAIAGLGDLAAYQKRLREETFVALLKLAAGDAARAAMPGALYPLGRVAHLPPSVIERTREVAQAALAQEGPERMFALRALARTDEDAAALLADVVRRAGDFNAGERAEAVRALMQLGGRGQRALRKLLGDLMPAEGPVAATSLIGDHFGVLLLLLSGLDSVGGIGGELRRLAQLPVSGDLPRPIRRRVSLLRCAAGKLLAERRYDDPLITGCDVTETKPDAAPQPPDLPPLAALASVHALGMPNVKLRGKRLVSWLAFAKASDPRVRAAALEVLIEHGEVEQSAQILAEALRSDLPGVVAAAAQVITKVPLRAAKGGKKGEGDRPVPHPDVVAALVERLSGTGPTADVEALAAVIDAAGALVVAEAEKPLRTHCSASGPTVRRRAQVALSAILGRGKKVVCEAPAEGLNVPKELDALVREVTEVRLQTDAGELVLRLDPSFAPVAVTRIVSLVRAGFFDGMAIHRVVPGFVTQLGSPTGDGFGPTDQPALPCETSPARFTPGSIGMALAGRDTGSTQLFVTHGSFPRLDGQYAWLGTASGPWGAVVEGDVIRKAKLSR